MRLHIINGKGNQQTNNLHKSSARWLKRYLEGVEISDKFVKFFAEVSEN